MPDGYVDLEKRIISAPNGKHMCKYKRLFFPYFKISLKDNWLLKEKAIILYLLWDLLSM